MPKKGKGEVRCPIDVCCEDTCNTSNIKGKNCPRRCDRMGKEQRWKSRPIKAEHADVDQKEQGSKSRPIKAKRADVDQKEEGWKSRPIKAEHADVDQKEQGSKSRPIKAKRADVDQKEQGWKSRPIKAEHTDADQKKQGWKSRPIKAEYTDADQFNYDAGLLRLKKAAGEGLKELIKIALQEMSLIQKVKKGWDHPFSDVHRLRTDNSSLCLMQKHGLQGRPVFSTGDGNCLFNAVSIALVGSEKLCSELRYRSALNLILNPAQVREAHPQLGDIYMVSPDYKEAIFTCPIPGQFSSSWNIMALTHVIGLRIKSLYPAENGPKDQVVKILNTTFGSSVLADEIKIMWTNHQHKKDGKIWTPNHFVPVVKEEDGVKSDEEGEEDGVELVEECEEDGVELDEEGEEDGVELVEECEEDGVKSDEECEEDEVKSDEECEEDGVKSDEGGEEDGVKSDEEGEEDGVKSDEEGEEDGVKSDEEGEEDGVKSDEEGEEDGVKSDEEGEEDGVKSDEECEEDGVELDEEGEEDGVELVEEGEEDVVELDEECEEDGVKSDEEGEEDGVKSDEEGEEDGVELDKEGEDDRNVDKGQALPNGTFLDLEKLINVLQTSTREETRAEIPRGKKENVFFVVDNEDNIKRRDKGKPSKFWDDRGSWNNGSSNKTLFIKNTMKKVVLKEGKYCFDRRQPGHKNKRSYIPLEPQPDSGGILILRRYYTKHTQKREYQKRVSWLEKGQAAHCACHEYMGKCPLLKPHRRTTSGNPGSYIRLKPSVMDQIKNDINNKGPSNIYNSFDLVDGPRNVRQVHNAKQRTSKVDHVIPGHVHKSNFADQVTGVEGLQRTTPFVKLVIHQPKKVPCIILYLDEQMGDVKRFCCPPYSAESTVLCIDKTFNLSNVHVTVTTFKNLSLKRRTTGAHPLFIGPLLLHGNSDVDTFFLFLHHIAGKLFDATTSPTFGSDEEAALTKAIARAFPSSIRMSCTRHLEENLKSFLADREGLARSQRTEIVNKVFGRRGLLQTASDAMDFSDSMHFLAESMSDEARRYLLKIVLPPLMRNLQALQRPGLHQQDKRWTNNNSESTNHVLKQAVSWKSLRLVDLVEKLQGVIKAQYREVQRSFFGSGEYELCDEFRKYKVQPDIWFEKSDTQKQRHYHRFLATVKDVDVVRSTDGTRTVTEPKHRGKKPGQVKRKRAAKTTTTSCKKFKLPKYPT